MTSEGLVALETGVMAAENISLPAIAGINCNLKYIQIENSCFQLQQYLQYYCVYGVLNK